MRDTCLIYVSTICLPVTTRPLAVLKHSTGCGTWSASTERCDVAALRKLIILMHFICTISLLTRANHRQKGARQFDWNGTWCWLQTSFLGSAKTYIINQIRSVLCLYPVIVYHLINMLKCQKMTANSRVCVLFWCRETVKSRSWATSSLSTFAVVNSIFVGLSQDGSGGVKSREILSEWKTDSDSESWICTASVTAGCFSLPQISWSSNEAVAPFLRGFLSSSLGVDGLRVVSPPKRFTLIICLGLITQKYEAVIIHPHLNVSGAWGMEKCRLSAEFENKLIQ